MAHCANCVHGSKYCKTEGCEVSLKDCPTKTQKDIIDKAKEKYFTDEFQSFNLNSLRQVASGYEVDEDKKPHPVKTRLQEIVEFCNRMGYKKIGLAFCTALEVYAMKLTKVLESNGFEVVSVICKVGGITKEDIGLDDCDKIVPGRREITCNPIGQAAICNNAKTEFNILLGLCVGHDSMFLKSSDALCTVFAVKDRVLKHNPLLALEDN